MFIEEIQSWLTIFDSSVVALVDAFNTFDNDIISMVANVGRFFSEHSMVEDFALLLPFGLIAVVASLVLDGIYNHRYRDTWDAYLRREFDRLEKKIQHPLFKLSSLTPAEKNAYHSSDTYKRRLAEIASLLAKYKYSTQQLQAKFAEKKYKDERKEIEKVVAQIQASEAKLRELGAPLPDISNFNDNPNAETTKPKTPSPSTSNEESEKANNPLKTLSQFADSPWFKVPFYYAWGYWFVFFFARWGFFTLPAVPLLAGGLAFICPLLYLVYKEVVAYNKALMGEKHDTDFRWSWLFLAALAGLSVNVSYWGLAEIAIPLGIGVGIGVLLVALGVSIWIDEKLQKHLSEQKTTSPVEPQSIKQQAFEREQQLKEMILKFREIKRAAAFEEWKKKFQLQAEALPQLISQNNKAAFEQSIQEQSTKNTNQNKALETDLKSDDGVKKALGGHTTTLEKTRGILVTALTFCVGYMLGCIIGFVAFDFLSHIPLLAPFTEGFSANLVTGTFSLLTGVSYASGAWLDEQVHLKDLETKRLDKDYLKNASELSGLNALNAILKDGLKRLILESPTQGENLLPALKALKPLVEPNKKWQLKGYNVLKILRNVLFAITSISTVLLMSRAFLVMAFSKAFLPSIVSGPLTLFGSASVSPLGIFVLALAGTFLLLRLVNKMYMAAQKEEELEKISCIKRRLKEAKVENKQLLTLAKTIGITIPQSTAHQREAQAGKAVFVQTSDEKTFCPDGKSVNGEEDSKSDDIVQVQQTEETTITLQATNHTVPANHPSKSDETKDALKRPIDNHPIPEKGGENKHETDSTENKEDSSSEGFDDQENCNVTSLPSTGDHSIVSSRANPPIFSKEKKKEKEKTKQPPEILDGQLSQHPNT